MKIRLDLNENVLRSVGDGPVGILGVALPDDRAAIIVDPFHDPFGSEPGVVKAQTEPEGISENATPLAVDDVIAGCETVVEIAAVYAMVCQALIATAPYYLERGRTGYVRSHLDLCEAVATSGDAEVGRRNAETENDEGGNE